MCARLFGTAASLDQLVSPTHGECCCALLLGSASHSFWRCVASLSCACSPHLYTFAMVDKQQGATAVEVFLGLVSSSPPAGSKKEKRKQKKASRKEKKVAPQQQPAATLKLPEESVHVEISAEAAKSATRQDFVVDEPTLSHTRTLSCTTSRLFTEEPLHKDLCKRLLFPIQAGFKRTLPGHAPHASSGRAWLDENQSGDPAGTGR